MPRIGVDVGGTFTDFAAWRDAPAALTSYKVSSTPPSFIEGCRAGFGKIIALLRPGPGESVIVLHGTTVSTNTIIERNGARLALPVTRGFRDILDPQRFRLDDPISINAGRTTPLVPRHLVFEVTERLEPDGSPHTPLDRAAVLAAGEAARAAGASSLAIACVLNAYVKTRMANHLAEVEAYLEARHPGTKLFITRSNGGAMAAVEARRYPIQTLLSGPASGVTAPDPRTGRIRVGVVDPLIGGSRGHAHRDGVNAVDPRFGQTRNVPIEVIAADACRARGARNSCRTARRPAAMPAARRC